MPAERLRMRLREHGRIRETWEAHLDPEKPKTLRSALLGAVVDYLGEDFDGDPEDHLGRFCLEWQGRTGGWKTFRAGS